MYFFNEIDKKIITFQTSLSPKTQAIMSIITSFLSIWYVYVYIYNLLVLPIMLITGELKVIFFLFFSFEKIAVKWPSSSLVYFISN